MLKRVGAPLVVALVSLMGAVQNANAGNCGACKSVLEAGEVDV